MGRISVAQWREWKRKESEERILRLSRLRSKGIHHIQMAMDFPADNLSLQRLAMISYVSAFWSTPNIQVELAILFKNLRVFDNKEESITNFFNNVNEVLKKLVNLPRLLLNDLMHVNILIGLRIIDWYEQLFREFGIEPRIHSLYFNSIRNLHFTCFGTVDEAKIIQTECLKSEFLLMTKNYSQTYEQKFKDLEYYTACSCIQKNYLKQHSTEIITAYKKYSASSNYVYGLNIDYHFILCSAYFFEGCEGELRKIIKKEGCCSIELYMFLLAARNCSEIAVRYYWQILNDGKELVKAALQMFKLMRENHCGSYLKILYSFAFLLTQMSETEKQDFFCQLVEYEYSNFYDPLKDSGIKWNHMVNIFECLAAFPLPTERFFSPLFDIFKSKRADQFRVDKERYGILLRTIHRLLYKYQNLGLDVKKCEKYKMFFIVFYEIQIRFNKDSSLIGDEENHFYTRNKVEVWYKIFDIEILGAIINFACGKDYRRKALCIGNEYYKKLIAAEEYNKLNMFMEVVLTSKEEREWFKGELLHFVPDFIMEDRFDIADKLLNWGLSSEEEKKLFKHGLDIMSICGKIYFEDGAILSGKILKWFFPNDEDKTEYVSNFAFEKFWGLESKAPLPFIFVECLKRQYKEVDSIRPFYLVHPKFELLNIILAEGEDSFIANAEKYLNWFLNSKKEVDEFKTRVLLNECVFKNFVKNTFLFKHEKPEENLQFRFKLVEKYLKFCASSESYELLKSKYFRDIDEWILYLSKNYVGVDQIDDFLDWIVKEVPSPKKHNLKNTENIISIDKPLIIKNFLLSSHATEFFENLVRQHNVYSRSKNRFAAWLETLEGENEREIVIDLSAIESSLNYYHWQYCTINGKLEELIPQGPSEDGPLPYCRCACDLNIIHLNDVLKNKKNFEVSKPIVNQTMRRNVPHRGSERQDRECLFYISKLLFSKR